MPLPIRIPCNDCRGDRLFVWIADLGRWRCNDCGALRTDTATRVYTTLSMAQRQTRSHKRKAAQAVKP